MNCRRILISVCLLLINAAAIAILTTAESCVAGDWPQILGPQRDGATVGEKLLKEWPAEGPKLIWKSPVGEGFAGVAVRGDLAVVFHRIDDEEVAEGRSAANGEQLWTTHAKCDYRPTYTSDSGPRCVPLISGDR
ncbi:MAG: hypothetical protein KDA89_22100, partial [Planctomycetaceae bacterium]|nr:hypothetical protein [Planctomycetaceae bacterium]